jgi:hypothetical protein
MSAHDRAMWERDRQRQHEMSTLRMTLQANKTPEDRGSFSFAGTKTDDGRPIYLHSKRGPHVQDATGALVPYLAERIAPKNPEMSSHEKEQYHKNRASSAQVDTVLAQVTKNPDAVGAIGYLPNTVSQYIPGDAGEGGVGVRASVANLGSLKIHDRSGAAVTVGEMPRLRPFIPNVTWDSPETIKTKLDGFRLEYDSILKEIEGGNPLSLVIAASKKAHGPTATGQVQQLTPRQIELNKKYGVTP